MKKFLSILLTVALLACAVFFVACDGNGSKKKVASKDQDFSSSGMIKDIEEMQKAAEKGRPTAPPAGVAPQESRK